MYILADLHISLLFWPEPDSLLCVTAYHICPSWRYLKKKKKKKYFPFDKYDIFCHIIFCLLKTVTFYTHYLFIYIYLWPWTKFGEKFFKLLIYIFLLSMNFENLTVEFHVSYVLNMYIKFRSNWILFTIWSTNLFFIYNFRLQKFEIITFIWWRSNWSLIFLKFCKH